eukprot:1149051-Pelagomonas_calceolata.AAC.4
MEKRWSKNRVHAEADLAIKWAFKLASNDQRSWTSAALRSSNHAVVSDFAEAHWGNVLVGGPIETDVGAEGRDLCQLAPAASCHPQFGTKLQGAIMLPLKLEWAQTVAWLKFGILKCLLTLFLEYWITCWKFSNLKASAKGTPLLSLNTPLSHTPYTCTSGTSLTEPGHS